MPMTDSISICAKKIFCFIRHFINANFVQEMRYSFMWTRSLRQLYRHRSCIGSSSIVPLRFFHSSYPISAMGTKLRAALIDLSGTLHIEDQILPGALEGVDLLRKNNILLKFVTNTTKESRHSLLKRLRHLGFEISDDEILTSLTAAKLKVESENLRPLLFLEESAKEEFDDIPTRDFDSVVIGLAPNCLNHESMSMAMNVLLDGGRLIAIHKAR